MRVTAGGKLVVLGEYHVLDPRGRALVAGVEPGVVVTLEPAARFRLDCPDVGVHGLAGMPDERGALRWDPAPPTVLHAARFAEAALAVALAVGEAEGGPPDPFALAVQSELGAGGDKAGLGGSASVAAAVAAGVLAWRGHDPTGGEGRDLALRVALVAHFVAQGRLGSGVDVAAAFAGGLALYRNPGLAGLIGTACAPDELARIARRPWPDLEIGSRDWPARHVILAGATGAGSSTRALLDRFAALEGEDARRYRDLRAALGRILDGIDGPEQLGAAMRSHQQALERFDAALGGGGIVTPGTARLVAIASGLGLPAKISGAGGGDSVIALVPEARSQALGDAWRAAGFAVRAIGGPADALAIRP